MWVARKLVFGGWKDKDLCYTVAKYLITLPWYNSKDCLARGERVGKQNVSSNLQKVYKIRKELACFQIKMKQCQKPEVLKSWKNCFQNSHSKKSDRVRLSMKLRPNQGWGLPYVGLKMTSGSRWKESWGLESKTINQAWELWLEKNFGYCY